MDGEKTYSAFAGTRRVATGELETMLRGAKRHVDAGDGSPLIIFEDQTGLQVDFDFRGPIDDVLARLSTHPLFAARAPSPPERRGPGRPRLGVVGREVTLLPRHWEWLERQPGGISVALRKLVDQARHAAQEGDRRRQAREATGRFLWALCGNLPHFEEVTRALDQDDLPRIQQLIAEWPEDTRTHVARLTDPVRP